MDVHLVDGTYELFRQFYAPRPGHVNRQGEEVGAVRAVLSSTLAMLADGATHVGVATDHVIESFRNELWPGYKTGAGIDPDLRAQFEPLEQALESMGVAVWPMVDHEADDALASAARVAGEDDRVAKVLICTPDKDLAQCVGGRVVQLDRRRGIELDSAAVRGKYGVAPESIPDWLALVGDSADGFPGLDGWGAKSAARVLARYDRIERIPADPVEWDVAGVRGAARLASVLAEERETALLFKDLATLRADADVGEVDEWRWRGPRGSFGEWCARLDRPELERRAADLARARDAETR